MHRILAGIQDEYIKYTDAVGWKGQTSTTFVFARFEDFSFRHDLLPNLLRLALPSYFLEFKRHEMSVPFVLDGNTSVSSEHRRMGLHRYLGFKLESNRRNKGDKLVDVFESTRDLGDFELSSVMSHWSASVGRKGGMGRTSV